MSVDGSSEHSIRAENELERSWSDGHPEDVPAGHDATMGFVNAGGNVTSSPADPPVLDALAVILEYPETGISRSMHNDLVGIPDPRDRVREAWLRAKLNRSGSVHTHSAYRHDIDLYFDWCDANGLDVFTVRGPQIEAYTAWLLRHPDGSKKRANSTGARMLTSVSSFYAYVVQKTDGQVRNPVEFANRPEVDSKSRTNALSRSELDALRRAARIRSPRDYAMVQLLAGTAIRVSELCNADTTDITTDGDYDILKVTRKGGKRGKVRLPAATLEALRTYIGGRTGPLFLLDNGKRMTRRVVDYRLGLLATDIDLKKRISPHSLRHTAATLALDHGVPLRDVQVQMGHARPDTTARYDQARRELNNRAADVLAKIVGDEMVEVLG